MKKLMVALVASAALILSGCELITGANADDSSNSIKGAVHGQIVLGSDADLSSGYKLRIEVVNEASLEKSLARSDSNSFTKELSITEPGTYAYHIKNIPDGSYRFRANLVNSAGTMVSSLGWSDPITIAGADLALPNYSVNYYIGD